MAYDLLSAPGVLARHADDCPARDGGRCTCGPIGYRASEEGRPIGPLMETSGEALRWRREQYASLEDAERDELVTAAIADFLDEATTGGVLTPDGRRYTGTERRALRQALTREVIPALGDRPPRGRRAPAGCPRRGRPAGCGSCAPAMSRSCCATCATACRRRRSRTSRMPCGAS